MTSWAESIRRVSSERGVRDVKLDEDLSEDQRRMLKYTRYLDVLTDMPRETDVIQHKVKLTDDTPI